MSDAGIMSEWDFDSSSEDLDVAVSTEICQSCPPPEIPDGLAKINPQCHPQTGSLFFKLSLEIQYEIYKLIFDEYKCETNPCKIDILGYPIVRKKRKGVKMALLYTCRRAFLETEFIRLQIIPYEFWEEDIAPESAVPFEVAPSLWTRKGVTMNHLRYMRRMHFYNTFHNVENSTRKLIRKLSKIEKVYNFQPQHITLTIFYTQPFGGTPRGDLEDCAIDLAELKWPDSLQRLRIRLESMKEHELESRIIMEELLFHRMSFRTRTWKDALLVPDKETKIDRWKRSDSSYLTRYSGAGVDFRGFALPGDEEIEYFAEEATWTLIEGTLALVTLDLI